MTRTTQLTLASVFSVGEPTENVKEPHVRSLQQGSDQVVPYDDAAGGRGVATQLSPEALLIQLKEREEQAALAESWETGIKLVYHKTALGIIGNMRA